MLPSVPTDSLYKFVALLSTSALFVLFFVLPPTLFNSLKDKHYEFLRKAATMEAKAEGARYTLDRVKKIIENYFKDKKGEASDPSKFPVSWTEDEIKQMIIRLEATNVELSVLKSEIDIIDKQTRDIDKSINSAQRYSLFGVGISTLLAIWAFKNWYRIQRAIDKETLSKARHQL